MAFVAVFVVVPRVLLALVFRFFDTFGEARPCGGDDGMEPVFRACGVLEA